MGQCPVWDPPCLWRYQLRRFASSAEARRQTAEEHQTTWLTRQWGIRDASVLAGSRNNTSDEVRPQTQMATIIQRYTAAQDPTF